MMLILNDIPREFARRAEYKFGKELWKAGMLPNNLNATRDALDAALTIVAEAHGDELWEQVNYLVSIGAETAGLYAAESYIDAFSN